MIRSIKCRALNTATIGETKNMNIPGAIITLPTLTESVIIYTGDNGAGHSRHCRFPEALQSGLHRSVLHPQSLRYRQHPQDPGSRAAAHSDYRQNRESGGIAELRRNPGKGGRHHGGSRRPRYGDGAREGVPCPEVHAA